jgi:hypothetical protein
VPILQGILQLDVHKLVQFAVVNFKSVRVGLLAELALESLLVYGHHVISLFLNELRVQPVLKAL